MSKGLRALKELKETCETHMGRMVYILQEDKFETIEKELKRLEELEIMYSNCVIEGAKQKKALDIISKKCSPLLKQYLLDLLPKEESKLVEEVLCGKEQKI